MSQPIGWAASRVGDVVQLKYGKSLPAANRVDGSIPVYGSNGRVGSHCEALVSTPGIVVGRKGSIGEVHLTDGPFWPIDTTYYVDELSGQPAAFWALLLKFLKLSNLDRASAIPGLNREDAYAQEVLVPPLAEQKRIVAKVEELTARSRRAREALDAVPPLLDQLRQSILAAAFHGDLTAAWRAKNPNVETADKLLARIRAERRIRSGMATDGDRDEKTRSVSAENAALMQPHLERTSSIGWAFAALEDLCDPTRPITYGIVQTGDPTIGGVPTVRCGDVTDAGIDIQRLKRVDREIEAQYPRTRLRGGEVLVAIRGTVGGVAVAGSNLAGANISREVAMLAPLPGVDSGFLALALSSPLGIAFLAHHTKGVAQAGVNIGDLRAFPVVVPPELEQREVVRKVNAAMEQVRKVATSVGERRTSLDLLEQSVRAKAFQGELVPQDPNEESAFILLDRIRAARSSEGGKAPVVPRRSRNAERVIEGPGDDDRESDVSPRRPDSPAAVSKELSQAEPEFLQDEISAALWTLGPLDKDAAVRRVADHLRQAGYVQFERLRADGPLFAQVLDAIESAVKAGRLDRPKRGHVRACKPDASTYTNDDWRHALVASLGTDPMDRDDAIRAGAEWARDNLGLEFARLRENGHIIEGLRSALNSAIRRGDVIRHDAKLISRKT